MSSVTTLPDPKTEFDVLLAGAPEVPAQLPSPDHATFGLPDDIERESLGFFFQGTSPELAARLRPELLSPPAADLLVRMRETRTRGLELRPSILELAGPSLTLFQTLTGLPPVSASTFTHHLEVLRERHRTRSFQVIYDSLRAQVEPSPGPSSPVPIDAALLAAMRQLEDTVRAHAQHKDPSLAGYDYLAEYRQRPERRPTRFRELNRLMIGGFYAGTMFLLSGEAGAGKTAFLLNLAADYARDGHRVVFFSLEMEAYEIASRLLTYLARDAVHLSALVNRKVSET
ncbi:MAG: AAA family ATPase, partial [Verrucomicrobia bacterium]|nr:AAA family ATPase [Verrucomicrobiota bacterium]